MILKKMEKSEICESALKLPKMQSCFEILEFIAKKEYFTNRSQGVKVYSSKTNKRFGRNGISARGRGSGKNP